MQLKQKLNWIKLNISLWQLEGTNFTIKRVPKPYGVQFQILNNGEYCGMTSRLKDSKEEIKKLIKEV